MSTPGVRHADHTLHTADGVSLDARWYLYDAGEIPTDETDRAAVVLVHGFAATKEQPAVVATATRLAERGHPVLVYDSRGHGRSGGMCTLGAAERLDVEAAAQSAVETAEQVVVVGASMGGIAVLNHLAAGGGACGAVVASTPARWRVPRTVRGVMSVAVTQTPVGRAVASRLWGTTIATRPVRGAPPVEQIAAAGRPVAVIHGAADRFVPVASAQVLHQAAHPPRCIDIVPRMAHGYCTAAIEPIATAVGWVIDCNAAATRATEDA